MMEFEREDCLEKLRAQEDEYEGLKAKVDALAASAVKNAAINQESAELDAQIESLTKDNTKLQYRLKILKKAVDRLGIPHPSIPSSSSCDGGQEEQSLEAMDNVIRILEGMFRKATVEVFPQLKNPQISVHPTSKPQFGDYQFNSAMGIAKALAETGTKKPPRDIANSIVERVPVGEANPLIASLEVAGPGFVNIRLHSVYVCEGVRRMLKFGVKPPNMGKKRVVIDFSSPNIAKEMHVGHLRSTIIGECIARLLEYVGYDVLRINHLGDWGTQFGMLIAHLQEKFPNFKQETPAIGDLQALYKESKNRFDNDPEFKKRAYAAVKALQSHEPDQYLAWQQICDVSRKEFLKLYNRLDVTLTDRGESFYQSRMEAVVADLESMGLLIEEDGRKLMFPDPKKSPLPLTVVKSDGSYTYDTSDMATIRQRIEEEKGDWLIYVTDEGQAIHFKSFLSCAEICGYWDPSKVRIDHVTFGVVLGEDRKKFKTRSGETVRLADLLDEGIRRAEEKLKEKGREKEMSEEEFQAARDNVALGCIRYNDLCHNRNHEYVFSFDKMLEDKGNTAAYLLYQYTRIKSICRTAGVEEKAVLDSVADQPLVLDHIKEMNLAKTLLKFPVILERLLDDLLPHSLCDYLYEVSQVFSEFYDNCYCVEKDKETKQIAKIHFNRLALCEATTRIMAACFHILGLKTVQKM